MRDASVVIVAARIAFMAIGLGVATGVAFLVAAGAYEALLDWLRRRRP